MPWILNRIMGSNFELEGTFRNDEFFFHAVSQSIQRGICFHQYALYVPQLLIKTKEMIF